MARTMRPSDEEIAYRLVELYVREISRGPERRKMGLDTIINAYYYSLARLKKKKKEMGIFETAVEEEERAAEELGFPFPVGEEELPFEKELRKAAEEAKKELEKEETEEE